MPSPLTSSPDNPKLKDSPSRSLDEFLQTALCDVITNIPKFRNLAQPLVVPHNDTIASVLVKLHDRRLRTAVVARVVRRWNSSCTRQHPVDKPRGPEVLIKQKMLYSLSIYYSFFDVRVCRGVGPWWQVKRSGCCCCYFALVFITTTGPLSPYFTNNVC